MAIPVNDNIKVNAPKPSDPRFFAPNNTPWASVQAVEAGIPLTERHPELPVNIMGIIYWWKNGAWVVQSDDTKLAKGNFVGTAETLNTKIDSILGDSTVVNGVTTSSAIPSTGNIHALGVGPGTYTNWGGMVVPANNIGTLQRVGGVYSVSLTPIDLTGKVNVSDVINNLTSSETEKPGSANNDRLLSEKLEAISNSVKVVEQPDGFYLTDSNGYVIAKVTSAGVQSVAFLNKAGVSLSGISDYINVNLMPDGFHFTDDDGYTVAKITKDGIQSTNYLDKDGNTLKSTSLTTLIKGLEFYSLGDSLSAANLWQSKLAELTNSTFNATVNTNTPLSVGGTRTGGVNTTCGQWRAKLLFELNVNPKVIFIENINDVNVISSLGTIDDEPFMLQNIITYPTTFASLTALNTWLADGSFETYLGTFATLDRKIGSGIRFPYTDETTKYREYIFDSKIVANWTNTTLWKYETNGATIYEVYKGLLEYLKDKFPTALIMWFAPTRIAIQTVSGQSGYNATFWNADGSFNMTTYKAHVDSVNYKTLVDAQKKVCEYYAVPFINVNEECGINPLNFLTYYPQYNVHPLPLGYEKWGETIAKLI
jgi:hypothetical protein